MWSSRTEHLSGGRVIKFAIDDGSSLLTYSDVLALWQGDFDFRKFFGGLLIQSPFSAFRWETPPVTIATVDQPFEFVLIDSPHLECEPDPSAFAQHFSTAPPGGAVEFQNLGNDAILVVPCPDRSQSDFGHMATFLRNSSEPQRHTLWELVGTVMRRRLSTKPVWLSTAGGGVAWLHVRLDDRPKYYGYELYRNVA